MGSGVKDPKALADLVLGRLRGGSPAKGVRSLYLSDANYEAIERLAERIGKSPSAVVDELLGVFLEGCGDLNAIPAVESDEAKGKHRAGASKARRPVATRRRRDTEPSM